MPLFCGEELPDRQRVGLGGSGVPMAAVQVRLVDLPIRDLPLKVYCSLFKFVDLTFFEFWLEGSVVSYRVFKPLKCILQGPNLLGKFLNTRMPPPKRTEEIIRGHS